MKRPRPTAPATDYPSSSTASAAIPAPGGPCSRRSAFPRALVGGRLFDLRRSADRERVRALVASFEAEAEAMPEFNPDA